jgi:hypothetical protein
MKKEIKKVEKSEMLSTIQSNTIKQMIINSMAGAFEGKKARPDEAFFKAANLIADTILHNAQMALIQNGVFDKAVNKTSKKSNKKSKK